MIVISASPLRPLRLRGELNRRDAENAETAQRCDATAALVI